MIPVKIDFSDNFINFRHLGSDNILTKTKHNLFEENTGLTIRNPDIDIPAYLIQLSRYGKHIKCGHIIDNFIGYLRNADLENIVLVVDFSEVSEVSGSFAEQYVKFLLSTKSKVLSINQNTSVSNTISSHIVGVIEIKELL